FVQIVIQLRESSDRDPGTLGRYTTEADPLMFRDCFPIRPVGRRTRQGRALGEEHFKHAVRLTGGW
ncbi:MAG TPA: hypothetical protein VK724_23485, partial [Bryobacteraceae bacterium]|nr:hypothetical protein [Bryobacteraceae bacterium]